MLAVLSYEFCSTTLQCNILLFIVQNINYKVYTFLELISFRLDIQVSLNCINIPLKHSFVYTSQMILYMIPNVLLKQLYPQFVYISNKFPWQPPHLTISNKQIILISVGSLNHDSAIVPQSHHHPHFLTKDPAT